MSALRSIFGRAEFAAVGLTALWLLTWRFILETPWSLDRVSAGGGLIRLGIACHPIDTWSYLSWVQQYYHGETFAGLLYTTEPHTALLWLFPLWLIGKSAAWSGLSVLGVYNVAGFIGALAAVFCFLRAATALRMPASARHWAACAFVLGSGGSWLWQLAYKLGWALPADGADLYFLDLFPSTTLLAYTYHTLGFALLAALWWSTSELESRRLAGEPVSRWLGATFLIALLLGCSRPYEPLSFLGAWGLKMVWHFFHRRGEPAVWRNSAVIGMLLFVALAPGIGWTAWVSTQPVWSTFARKTLALDLNRTAWLWALGGWGIFIALGIGPAWRASARHAVLPLAASLLLGIILFSPGVQHTKLSSGLIFGPLLFSGWGAARVVAMAGRLPLLARIALPALVLSALFGIGSLFLNLNEMKVNGPALIEADVVTLAARLPFLEGEPPLVLTDAVTGGILPGLVGARVWVGHWSLSRHYATKVSQLQQAGLDPDTPTARSTESAHALEAILADAPFGYALIDRRCGAAMAGLTAHGWRVLETTTHWNLFQAPLSAP